MRSFSKILLVLSLVFASVLPAAAADAPILLRVSFAPDDATLSKKSQDAIIALATTLKASGERVELQAFAGDAANVTSTQRRISLKRALAVRQLLMDQGIPAEQMDVRALGGATGNTPLDRVDILQAGL